MGHCPISVINMQTNGHIAAILAVFHLQDKILRYCNRRDTALDTPLHLVVIKYY
jgi:hypothetical protein